MIGATLYIPYNTHLGILASVNQFQSVLANSDCLIHKKSYTIYVLNIKQYCEVL